MLIVLRLVPFAICFAYVFMYKCWFGKSVGYFVYT